MRQKVPGHGCCQLAQHQLPGWYSCPPNFTVSHKYINNPIRKTTIYLWLQKQAFISLAWVLSKITWRGGAGLVLCQHSATRGQSICSGFTFVELLCHPSLFTVYDNDGRHAKCLNQHLVWAATWVTNSSDAIISGISFAKIKTQITPQTFFSKKMVSPFRECKHHADVCSSVHLVSVLAFTLDISCDKTWLAFLCGDFMFSTHHRWFSLGLPVSH